MQSIGNPISINSLTIINNQEDKTINTSIPEAIQKNIQIEPVKNPSILERIKAVDWKGVFEVGVGIIALAGICVSFAFCFALAFGLLEISSCFLGVIGLTLFFMTLFFLTEINNVPAMAIIRR